MLSGRAPFVADDMGALFYQLINLDPHPLSRRAPGLPPDVEPVLRRALAKRAADRYPSIKEFSRAFESAATGRQREVTPAPVVVPSIAVPKGTVAYGEQVVVARSADAAPRVEITAPPAAVPEELASTYRDSQELSVDDFTGRRFKPVYLILVASIIVLVAGVTLLWPRKSPPSMAAPQTPTMSVPKQVPALRAPEVVTLPALPPAAPIAVPPPETEPARPAKAKSSKSTTLDGLLLRALPTDESSVGMKPSPFAGRAGAGRPVGTKPSPFADPFEPDEPPTGSTKSQARPRPPKARPQRPIIEEL